MKKIALAIAATLSLATSAVHADPGVIKLDWLSQGDGLIAFDTNTGLEWLSLTQTNDMSINQVQAMTGVGGQFEGWRLPTEDEVFSLTDGFYSTQYGHDATNSNFSSLTVPRVSVAHANYFNFEDLLGQTYFGRSFGGSGFRNDYRTHGLHLNTNTTSGTPEVVVSGMRARHGGNHSEDFLQFITGNESSMLDRNSSGQSFGVFLVSDDFLALNSPNISDVPIFGVGLLGLAGLVGVRRKK